MTTRVNKVESSRRSPAQRLLDISTARLPKDKSFDEGNRSLMETPISGDVSSTGGRAQAPRRRSKMVRSVVIDPERSLESSKAAMFASAQKLNGAPKKEGVQSKPTEVKTLLLEPVPERVRTQDKTAKRDTTLKRAVTPRQASEARQLSLKSSQLKVVNVPATTRAKDSKRKTLA